MIACENSGHHIDDDFPEVRKIVDAGISSKPILDYELSRYACYLIVQNGDPRKEVIALGQTYFAIQTYRQEVADHFNQLDEDNRRLVIRGDIKQWNQMLVETAHNAGVITNEEFIETIVLALNYKRATIKDLEILTETRIEVLRAANQLSNDVDMSEVKKQSYAYYQKSLENDTHIAYLIFDDEKFVGAGGISYFQVMPTYHNPTGKKAYIMNMYTNPNYRRQGIAFKGMNSHYGGSAFLSYLKLERIKIMNIKKNIYLMYAIALLQGMVFYGSIATLYRQASGITIFQITLIESISYILCILFEIPWGIVADKIGYFAMGLQ